VTPDGHRATARGAIEGNLADERRGSNGFGYDPIFVPLGETRTTAEMTAEEKDAISHRGKAFRGIVPAVAAFASGQSLPPISTA
jgi:XTP/dITP diphosphohydrolase